MLVVTLGVIGVAGKGILEGFNVEFSLLTLGIFTVEDSYTKSKSPFKIGYLFIIEQPIIGCYRVILSTPKSLFCILV